MSEIGRLEHWLRPTALMLLLLSNEAMAQVASEAPLLLESKIALGDVRGRIDHLAVDAGRQRLFVAELGNDSVGIVDLSAGNTVRTLRGFKAPQGIGYVPSTDTVYVANAGDGSVQIFEGQDVVAAGTIALGDDADNVRVDDAVRRVYVGFGSGALAVIDTTTKRKIAEASLKAHPESFQLAHSGAQVFVNVPDAGEIAVVDRTTERQVAHWPTAGLKANFPMALDEGHQTVLVVFRRPAKLGVLSAKDGRLLSATDTCGDADDVFFDPRRGRVYVSCGEGFIDVLAPQAEDKYASIGRVATVPGARTALFAREMDRLFLAVRATSATPAAIWSYRPTP